MEIVLIIIPVVNVFMNVTRRELLEVFMKWNWDKYTSI